MSLIKQENYSAFEFAAIQNVHVKTVYRWVREAIAPQNELVGRMLWFEKKAADLWVKPKRGKGDTRKGNGQPEK